MSSKNSPKSYDGHVRRAVKDALQEAQRLFYQSSAEAKADSFNLLKNWVRQNLPNEPLKSPADISKLCTCINGELEKHYDVTRGFGKDIACIIASCRANIASFTENAGELQTAQVQELKAVLRNCVISLSECTPAILFVKHADGVNLYRDLFNAIRSAGDHALDEKTFNSLVASTNTAIKPFIQVVQQLINDNLLTIEGKNILFAMLKNIDIGLTKIHADEKNVEEKSDLQPGFHHLKIPFKVTNALENPTNDLHAEYPLTPQLFENLISYVVERTFATNMDQLVKATCEALRIEQLSISRDGFVDIYVEVGHLKTLATNLIRTKLESHLNTGAIKDQCTSADGPETAFHHKMVADLTSGFQSVIGCLTKNVTDPVSLKKITDAARTAFGELVKNMQLIYTTVCERKKMPQSYLDELQEYTTNDERNLEEALSQKYVVSEATTPPQAVCFVEPEGAETPEPVAETDFRGRIENLRPWVMSIVNVAYIRAMRRVVFELFQFVDKNEDNLSPERMLIYLGLLEGFKTNMGDDLSVSAITSPQWSTFFESVTAHLTGKSQPTTTSPEVAPIAERLAKLDADIRTHAEKVDCLTTAIEAAQQDAGDAKQLEKLSTEKAELVAQQRELSKNIGELRTTLATTEMGTPDFENLLAQLGATNNVFRSLTVEIQLKEEACAAAARVKPDTSAIKLELEGVQAARAEAQAKKDRITAGLEALLKN